MKRVSVIMPVYNGEITLKQSLDSVLSNRCDGLELIVLDDGSSDGSWDIINFYPLADFIRFRHKNRGLSKTLNSGLGIATGKYIARQDQDDLILNRRFTKQADFLDAHPDIAMVGTWAQIYDFDVPTSRFHRHPSSCDALKLELLFDNPFVHSSIMIRADVMREIGGYSEDPSRQPPEDYELWSRIARKYSVANIPEVLTVYREMPKSMSRSGQSPFVNNVIKISAENLHYLIGKKFSYAECLLLSGLYHTSNFSQKKLSIFMVIAMLNSAAVAIAGNKQDWSQEFRTSYARISQHLKFRAFESGFPGIVVWIAVKLRRIWRGLQIG